MIQDLIAAFETDVINCLTETNDHLIEIYDCYGCIPDQQRSYIKTISSEPVHFTLINSATVKLTFAALDNCILKSHEQSRCDFIIGNFEKLYFVEVKQVGKGKRHQARTNAIQQLQSSISLLRRKLNLIDTDLIAVICLNAKQAHPLQNATLGAKRVAFKDSHNADLMEGNSHIF